MSKKGFTSWPRVAEQRPRARGGLRAEGPRAALTPPARQLLGRPRAGEGRRRPRSPPGTLGPSSSLAKGQALPLVPMEDTVSPCCKGHRNPWGPVGPPPAAASPQTPWVSDPAGPRLCSPGPRPWRGTDPRPGLQAALRPGLAHLSSLRPGRWPEAWPARHV